MYMLEHKGGGIVMGYNAMYRCQLCNKIFSVNNSDTHLTQQQAVELAAKAIQNQQFAGNPYLHQVPLYVVHNCNNRDAGIAYFAGFKSQRF